MVRGVLERIRVAWHALGGELTFEFVSQVIRRALAHDDVVDDPKEANVEDNRCADHHEEELKGGKVEERLLDVRRKDVKVRMERHDHHDRCKHLLARRKEAPDEQLRQPRLPAGWVAVFARAEQSDLVAIDTVVVPLHDPPQEDHAARDGDGEVDQVPRTLACAARPCKDDAKGEVDKVLENASKSLLRGVKEPNGPLRATVRRARGE
jgi:hypothetical protein